MSTDPYDEERKLADELNRRIDSCDQIEAWNFMARAEKAIRELLAEIAASRRMHEDARLLAVNYYEHLSAVRDAWWSGVVQGDNEYQYTDPDKTMDAIWIALGDYGAPEQQFCSSPEGDQR